jgi:hypothetical protein
VRWAGAPAQSPALTPGQRTAARALILRTAQFGSRTWWVSRVPGVRVMIRLALPDLGGRAGVAVLDALLKAHQ